MQVDCRKGPDSDKPAFAAFVRELREAFKSKKYLLTAAVSPSKVVVDAGKISYFPRSTSLLVIGNILKVIFHQNEIL